MLNLYACHVWVITELWRVVHTDYQYALVYVCRRSSAEDDGCGYETFLVLGRTDALVFNVDEMTDYFQLTLSAPCIPVASQLDVVADDTGGHCDNYNLK